MTITSTKCNITNINLKYNTNNTNNNTNNTI